MSLDGAFYFLIARKPKRDQDFRIGNGRKRKRDKAFRIGNAIKTNTSKALRLIFDAPVKSHSLSMTYHIVLAARKVAQTLKALPGLSLQRLRPVCARKARREVARLGEPRYQRIGAPAPKNQQAACKRLASGLQA